MRLEEMTYYDATRRGMSSFVSLVAPVAVISIRYSPAAIAPRPMSIWCVPPTVAVVTGRSAILSPPRLSSAAVGVAFP